MEKAYDRLDWNFIRVCMEKFGFSPVWINCIMECISTITFSVLINGCPGDVFKPTRGIRQGDPLSPYLFILCAEVLARLIQSASDSPKNPLGIRISRLNDKIPFITFADDTLIFTKATDEGCTKIKDILDKYYQFSRQKVNFHKSSFQCTRNITPARKIHFQGLPGMQEAATLSHYLGCPIIDGKITGQTFANIVTNTRNILSQ